MKFVALSNRGTLIRGSPAEVRVHGMVMTMVVRHVMRRRMLQLVGEYDRLAERQLVERRVAHLVRLDVHVVLPVRVAVMVVHQVRRHVHYALRSWLNL